MRSVALGSSTEAVGCCLMSQSNEGAWIVAKCRRKTKQRMVRVASVTQVTATGYTMDGSSERGMK